MDYITVAGPAQAELTEKRSRFISRIMPVSSQETAAAEIARIKKLHWDASHNVYAYRLLEGGISRSSDDGEPQGTSGAPTLEVLEGAGLLDTMIVTTRYFGGTLLGAGGLVRAYSQSARLAVEMARIQSVVLCARFGIRLDYSDYSRLAPVLSAFGAHTADSDFTDEVSLSVLVPVPDAPAFGEALREATLGRARIINEGEQYRRE